MANPFERPLTRRALSVGALSIAAGAALSACSDAKTDPTPTTTGESANAPVSSSAPSASASATPSASASATGPKPKLITNLDPIQVTGAFGKAPLVKAPWPIAINKTQSKAVIAGKGNVVPANATIECHYAGYNARNGQKFDDSFSKGQPAIFGLTKGQMIEGFISGLVGKREGDRVLIMMTAKDGYPQGNPDAKILPGDNLIFVVDINATSLDQPSGDVVPAKAGLPTVKDNGKGKVPTVTIGSAAKPTETVFQTLIKGKGRPVKPTDAVMAQYVAYGWESGKVLAEDYSTGPEAGMLSGLVPAWRKALPGLPIGSRVLIVSTSQDAYPAGNATPTIPPGETIVYVVDVLFAANAG